MKMKDGMNSARVCMDLRELKDGAYTIDYNIVKSGDVVTFDNPSVFKVEEKVLVTPNHATWKETTSAMSVGFFLCIIFLLIAQKIYARGKIE